METCSLSGEHHPYLFRSCQKLIAADVKAHTPFLVGSIDIFGVLDGTYSQIVDGRNHAPNGNHW